MTYWPGNQDLPHASLVSVETAPEEAETFSGLLWAGPPRALDRLGAGFPEQGSQRPILGKLVLFFLTLGESDTSVFSQDTPANPGAQDGQSWQPQLVLLAPPLSSPCPSPPRTCPPSLSLNFTGNQPPKPGWMVGLGRGVR